jgi:hypothetical protein
MSLLATLSAPNRPVDRCNPVPWSARLTCSAATSSSSRKPIRWQRRRRVSTRASTNAFAEMYILCERPAVDDLGGELVRLGATERWAKPLIKRWEQRLASPTWRAQKLRHGSAWVRPFNVSETASPTTHYVRFLTSRGRTRNHRAQPPRPHADDSIATRRRANGISASRTDRPEACRTRGAS